MEMAERIYTVNEDFNQLLDGGFLRGKVYIIAGGSGGFKSGLATNLLFQNRKKDSVGLLSSDEDHRRIEILKKNYFGKPGVRLTHSKFWQTQRLHNDVFDIVSHILKVKDMLILDEVYISGDSHKSSLKQTVEFMVELAQRMERVIVITMQTNQVMPSSKIIPDETFDDCELLIVKKISDARGERVRIRRGERTIDLPFANTYKII